MLESVPVDRWVAQVAETGAVVLGMPPSALVEHTHPLCALTEDEAGVFWFLLLKGQARSLQKANRQRRRHPRCPSGSMLLSHWPSWLKVKSFLRLAEMNQLDFLVILLDGEQSLIKSN